MVPDGTKAAALTYGMASDGTGRDRLARNAQYFQSGALTGVEPRQGSWALVRAPGSIAVYEHAGILALGLRLRDDNGQLAGAFNGETGIPDFRRSKLGRRRLIESFAERLCRLCRVP